MFNIDIDLEKYIQDNTTPEHPLLTELNRQTHLQVLMPRMLSGHIQGKFLEFVSKMIKPKKILELGTFTGYSAICLAQGLQEGGKLLTLERNDELETFTTDYIKNAGFGDRIEMRIGNALEIIPELENDWDLIFIDADKPNYPKYFDLLVDKVVAGGWIIADNVLWDGKVTDDPSTFDAYTAGIVEYNRKAQEDPRVENMILPFRDGLNILRKK